MSKALFACGNVPRSCALAERLGLLPSLVALLLFVSWLPVRGQQLSGTLVRGELRDTQGKGLAGAEVRLQSVASGRMEAARVEGGGEFGFSDVAPGEYVVSVRLMFSPFWAGRARVWLGGSVDGGSEDLDLWLTGSGGAAEVVRGSGVMEDRPLAEAARDAAAGSQLPKSTPGLHDALQDSDVLLHGASSASREVMLAGGGTDQDADGAQDTASAREEREAGVISSAGAETSPDGVPVIGGSPTVDGLAAGQGFRGGGSRVGTGFWGGTVWRGQNSLRSFSAGTGGVGSGSTRGLTTRGDGRGGLHGSLFLRARESGWAAVNPFAVETTYSAGHGAEAALVRPADSETHFGGAAGTTVRLPKLGERWRTGLFGSVEGQIRGQTLFSSPETADFYELSSEQRTLLANRGVHTAEIAAALGYLSGLSGPEKMRAEHWGGSGRADFAPGRGDRVGLGYWAVRSEAPAAVGAEFAEGVVNRAVGSVGRSSTSEDAITAQWVRVLGPRWVNELRGQLSRDLESEAPGPGNDAVPAVGPGGLAPQVSIALEGFSYGTPAALGRVAYPDERRVEVAETSTWRFGRHLLTAGGKWSRLDDRVLGATNVEGSFLYDSGTTDGKDGGLVDWISDYTYNVHAYPNGACPSVTAAVHSFCFRSYSQSFVQDEVEFETHHVAGFAEDSMRLGPGLKATVGARW